MPCTAAGKSSNKHVLVTPELSTPPRLDPRCYVGPHVGCRYYGSDQTTTQLLLASISARLMDRIAPRQYAHQTPRRGALGGADTNEAGVGRVISPVRLSRTIERAAETAAVSQFVTTAGQQLHSDVTSGRTTEPVLRTDDRASSGASRAGSGVRRDSSGTLHLVNFRCCRGHWTVVSPGRVPSHSRPGLVPRPLSHRKTFCSMCVAC